MQFCLIKKKKITPILDSGYFRIVLEQHNADDHLIVLFPQRKKNLKKLQKCFFEYYFVLFVEFSCDCRKQTTDEWKCVTSRPEMTPCFGMTCHSV